MDSVNLATAKALVKTNAVNRAVIECFDGKRWCIILRGSQEFRLKSERQNPKPFARVETALEEIKSLGLRHAEIDFVKWQREQKTMTLDFK